MVTKKTTKGRRIVARAPVIHDRYKIVRFYGRLSNRRTVKTGLTLEEVQKHCSDPETSSLTCKGKSGRALTRRYGQWFDGYERE